MPAPKKRVGPAQGPALPPELLDGVRDADWAAKSHRLLSLPRCCREREIAFPPTSPVPVQQKSKSRVLGPGPIGIGAISEFIHAGPMV